MKIKFRIVLLVIVVSFMTLSCKSNSSYLNDASVKLNKLAELMSDVKCEAEFDRLVTEFNQVMTKLPESIQKMTEEEILNVNGGKEYLEALELFNQVYIGRSRSFPSAECDQPIREYEPIVENNTTDNEAFNDIMNTEPKPEDVFILIPGVQYITASSTAGTNEFGLKASLDMEFIIYNDGSATGNLIETTEPDSQGNRNSYNHPVEGTWREVSKHDKRFLEIKLILEGDNYYNCFYYYIDEDLNAYANDINTRPVKLIEK